MLTKIGEWGTASNDKNNEAVDDNTTDQNPVNTQIPDITPTHLPVITPIPTPMTPPSTNKKILVAYFSWSGTSERIAQNIISQTGADSFRIERETPYSTDYNETAYGDAKVEAETNARPPIKNPLAFVVQYDKIVVCYPITQTLIRIN